MLERTQATPVERRDGPELYVGLALEVEAIVLGLSVLTAKVRDFEGAVHFKQDVSVKLLADDVAKVSGQISIMAAHVSSVVERYVNRKPRP